MKNLKNLALFFVFAVTFSSCIDDDKKFTVEYYKDFDLTEGILNISEEGPMEYSLEFPSYYRTLPVDFEKNDATLGRVMFYDTNLSADGTVSCASCHKQEIAFSDDKKLSDGIHGQVTKRNSLALGAVFNFQEYYGPNRVPFFWDNSVQTVEEQIEFTFGSKNEMDMTMKQVVDVMNSKDYYKPLIRAATTKTEVTEATAIRALAEFVNSLGSYNSRFDQALSKEVSGRIGFGQEMASASINFKDFTEAENNGKSIYLQNCSSCHGEIMGAPNVLQASNGIEVMSDDYGVANTTGQFKVPSLRNLGHSYPYMHDGRMATIDEVIEHYSTGIQATSELHSALKENNGDPRKFNFSEDDKSDLKAFLLTMDDPSFIADPKYSDPFIR